MLTLAEENYLKAIYHLERAIHGMSGSSPAMVGTGLLAESMGVQAPTATDMVRKLAEQLEHIQLEELIDRLEQHLGYPSVDPHGDPIPDAQGHLKTLPTVSLANATVGQTYVMAGITDHSKPFLHYLDKLGLGIGKRLEVLYREEFDNSLTVRIGDQQRLLSVPKRTPTF